MIRVPDRSRFGAGFRLQPADDWPDLRTLRANVLVSGPREATHAFILALIPHLHAAVRDCSAGDALPASPADGTLILRGVDALDGEQQRTLLRWLDDPLTRWTQVVSTAAAPLYPAVQAGTFSDRLYYHLNVVLVEVTAT
jgi:hypothetical protein